MASNNTKNSASEPTELVAVNDSKRNETRSPGKADRPVSVQLGDLRLGHRNGRGAPTPALRVMTASRLKSTRSCHSLVYSMTSSGPTFRVDHTVIDPGYHRLADRTITGAPPNYRCRGDPVGSARPANGRLRRTSPIPVRLT